MRTTSWFGGLVRRGHDAVPVPIGARMLHLDGVPATSEQTTTPVPVPLLWSVGSVPTRAVSHRGRTLAVFGVCEVSDSELREVLDDGLTDALVREWAGCYTVVEVAPTRTTILTDPAGAQPVYVAEVSAGLAWGSSSRALAPLTGYRLDLGWLERLLVRPPLHDALLGGSAFAGVRLMPPGARIELAPGRPPVTRTAWSPSVPPTVPALAGRGESTERAADKVFAGVERLRAALSSGVRVRAETTDRITADCSGGLDSTAVCLLAGPERVIAINVQPPHVDATEPSGDLAYVREVDAAYPLLHRRRVVVSDPQLPYAAMDALPPTDEPPRSVVVSARFAHVSQILRELGSTLHLTGDGADALLTPPLGYLRTLPPVRAWRHLRGWAILRGTSPWRLMRDLPTEDPIAAVVGAVRLAARPAASDLQLAESHGLRYASPFFDNQVVDAVTSVPVAAYASPSAYKPLLAKAFADLLPRPVAERGTKATFLPD
ncbi:MAG TPA: asparagine synthase-related protein, partial [Actinopolymorphaceae bacterium]